MAWVMKGKEIGIGGFGIFGERCAELEGAHWACAGGRAMLG